MKLFTFTGLVPVAKCTLIFTLGISAFAANAMIEVCEFDDPQTPLDPLVIDLGQDGIHLGEKGVGVMFDLMANGSPIRMQWTAPGGNEAFVVIDKNGNGIADDGSELLTNYNWLMLENTVAANGFADLAQYDQTALGGNDDGFISNADAVWHELNLWLDKNADGISTAHEMIKPANIGLTHFYTIPKENKRRDPAGNLLPLWSWGKNATAHGNNKFKMIDVFFLAVPGTM
jgi:hypothetical protein